MSPLSFSRSSRFKAILKKAFVAFNLYAILIWALPPFALRGPLMAPVRPYMHLLGLWQGWDLFGPVVLKLSTRLSAQVDYLNGHSEQWLFPTETDFTVFAEFRAERVRKFSSVVRQDSNEKLWPGLAAAIALRMQRPDTEIASISLTRHWRETPKMKAPLEPALESSYTFYKYTPSLTETN
jgi:hypothetical protein